MYGSFFKGTPVTFLRTCRYGLEAFVGGSICLLFAVLPLNQASALAAFLGRRIGPFLRATRTASANLRVVFPDWTEAQIRDTVRDMWSHLGRIVAEYFHAKDFDGPQGEHRIQVCGSEILEALKAERKPILFVSAHFGNWQMATLAAKRYGIPVWQFYRPANNPWSDAIMRYAQNTFVEGVISKSAHSFRNLVIALKKGRHILVFFDQYMHKGMPIPFFGRPALTAPVTVRLAQKLGCSLVPFYVERLKGSTFRVTFESPLSLHEDELTLLTFLNQRLESWIRLHPEQWFWVHDRWKET